MDIIKVSELSKTFSNGYKGLDSVNISFKSREFTVIGGKNGSGKTLLMKHIAGLEYPDSGDVLYNGESIFNKKNKNKAGLIFQDADSQILGETVYDDIAVGPKNLRLDKKEISERVNGVLSWANLEEKKNNHPYTLSGGEKRRLAIAGMLALDYEVLIFDEPFANLDYPSIVHVLESLVKLNKEGRTILVLTHELEKVLAHADRLVIIDKGKIMYDGYKHDFKNADFEKYGIRSPFSNNLSQEQLTWLP